jgi:hypothetical protein
LATLLFVVPLVPEAAKPAVVGGIAPIIITVCAVIYLALSQGTL